MMPALPIRLAVVIGIDRYSGGIPVLRNAVRDARAISAVLAHHGFNTADGTLIQLIDDEATHDALHELFTVRLPALVGPDHRVFVYFAGHGQAVPDGDRVLRGFLLPIDAAREGRTRYLAMDVVRGALAGLSCRHLFIALDCCSAGAFARVRYRDVLSFDDELPLIHARFEAMQRRRAFQVLASASYDERALDSFEAKVAQDAFGEHSPFARAMLEALTPPSIVDRDRDGVITATELYAHARRVLEAAAQHQTPNLWPLEWHDDGEFTFLFGEPRLFVPRALTRDESPYRGLEPFREDDARIFFGRREVARALADRIRASPLVAVVGQSGAGKTSLLRAGVVPLLRADAIVCGPVRIGASPFAALAEALSVLTEAPVAATTGDARPVVLIIDPLEELVTMKASPDERASLLALLRAAIMPGEDPSPPTAAASLDAAWAGLLATCASILHAIRARLHLVLAMRSDYVALFADQLASAEVWAQARYVVPPMNRDELRDCIELPAASRFLVFSPDPGPGGARLVDSLLDEVEQMPGGLPLLSVALDELFRSYVSAARDDRTLGWDEHRAIGGIDGALRRRAEDVYGFGACDPDERAARQASLRELMLRLIAFEAGALARRRVHRGALEFTAARETERTQAVLAALTDARLVVTDGDIIELAHDSLIHGWPRVLSWIDPTRASLLDRLADATAEWVAAPRARKALPLWDDDRLFELHFLVPGHERVTTRELLERLPSSTLNRDERAFVNASDRARRRRRIRVVTLGTAIALALVGAAVYSQIQRATVEASSRENQELLARSYQEAGRQLLVDGHPQESVPYLVEAKKLGAAGPALQMLFAQTARSLPLVPSLEHQGIVWSATFSPDGARVVTASYDHTAQVWDVATGQPLGPPLQHRESVRSAVFSPDGSRVATASDDNTAHIWDAATGTRRAGPLEHLGAINSAVFSPDGSRIVTASSDNTARIWDAATGMPLAAPLEHSGPIGSAVFSPDGKRVVTASDDQTARIWDTDPGRPIARSLQHQGAVITAAFSPDGMRVVTASSDYTARVWDAATGEPLAPPLSHDAPVNSAAFSPDGTLVVTASNRTARFWEAGTGELVGSSFQHQESVNTAVFSPDGKRVVTASYDQTARIWEIRTALASSLRHQGEVRTAVFSPEGKRVVTASYDKTARIWDTSARKLIAPLLGHLGFVNRATFSPEGKRIVTASDDQTARIWDATTGKPITRPLQHQGDVNDAAFSPDGSRVVTASSDNTARIWDAVTGKHLTDPLPHKDFVWRAVFSPDGARVATASYDGTGRIWDAATGRPLTPPMAHLTPLFSVAFSPDGMRVIFASEDHTARVWNAVTGEPITALLLHWGAVRSAAFSPDGARVITASEDYTARIWDAVSGKPLVSPLQHQGGVKYIAFSPDATRVITASDDNTARVWDAITGKPLTAPLRHRGSVVSAAFSPDGAQVVTASEDHTARIWEIGGTPVEGSALAERSPFILSGGVHVPRAPRPRGN